MRVECLVVIPAKAEIQRKNSLAHRLRAKFVDWIPAYAGMTGAAKMMSIARLIAITLLMLAASPLLVAAKQQSATDYVLSLYDPDALGGTARYTPRTQKLWDDCFRIAKKNGDILMDFSMIVMGNDFDLSDVHAVLIKEDKKNRRWSMPGSRISARRPPSPTSSSATNAAG